MTDKKNRKPFHGEGGFAAEALNFLTRKTWAAEFEESLGIVDGEPGVKKVIQFILDYTHDPAQGDEDKRPKVHKLMMTIIRNLEDDEVTRVARTDKPSAPGGLQNVGLFCNETSQQLVWGVTCWVICNCHIPEAAVAEMLECLVGPGERSGSQFQHISVRQLWAMAVIKLARLLASDDSTPPVEFGTILATSYMNQLPEDEHRRFLDIVVECALVGVKQ